MDARRGYLAYAAGMLALTVLVAVAESYRLRQCAGIILIDAEEEVSDEAVDPPPDPAP